MGLTAAIIQWVTHLIDIMGYPGVAFLMMLESMVAPVPSEAVMPFAGCLITVGRFSFLWVAVSSTIGSIVGSLLSYTAGYYGGKPFVIKFGRYVLLNLHDLEVTERFFNRHGSITIFISRFIPVIRHLISIPAGVGRMNLVHFSIYTIVGACAWNTFLAWLGYHLGNHWELIHKYSGPIDAAVLVIIALGLTYFVRAHVRRAAR
jgi:membrane protein DedA with SNARE-associated domain